MRKIVCVRGYPNKNFLQKLNAFIKENPDCKIVGFLCSPNKIRWAYIEIEEKD